MLFTPTSHKRTAILIAIDSTSNLGVLFDYLKGFGFELLEANSGQDTLEIAKHAGPDIILLDLKLSDIDGFETCRRLKADDDTRNIPVIFITSQTSTVNKVKGFALGAVDYITKPIQSEEVVARLKTHLTLQHLQSELEAQNLRLQQEIAEREKLIDELDAFAHTVAHDLKDPLGVTVNYAQFLKSYHPKLTSENLEDYADRIFQNGLKMNEIIEALLLLSSVRTEEVKSEPLDMAVIVDEAQNRIVQIAEEYQAEIVTPELWPVARGYAPWVEEIWANYLSNAIKYGGQPPEIELGATIQNNSMIKFWVKDNGAGLSPEAQAKLFVPFSRLNQVKVKGHGLGLSIVQRIVTRLGGEVGIESNGTVPGGGSIFSFSLPQAAGTNSTDT